MNSIMGIGAESMITALARAAANRTPGSVLKHHSMIEVANHTFAGSIKPSAAAGVRPVSDEVTAARVFSSLQAAHARPEFPF